MSHEGDAEIVTGLLALGTIAVLTILGASEGARAATTSTTRRVPSCIARWRSPSPKPTQGSSSTPMTCSPSFELHGKGPVHSPGPTRGPRHDEVVEGESALGS
jgi:hypothetical protein